MRPVARGHSPKRVYKNFQEALPYLENALGKYCSYCERYFPNGLGVEHIVPKSQNKRLKKTWGNFLLACLNCNSAKKAKRIDVNSYLWPDRDNTYRAFRYDNGLVDIAPELGPKAHQRAEKLMTLFGLHRHLGQPKQKDKPAKRDERATQREKVWKLALIERNKLAVRDDVDRRYSIVEIAKAYGYFSVWMAVFASDKNMRCQLISAFKGTAPSCFNAAGLAVARGRV